MGKFEQAKRISIVIIICIYTLINIDLVNAQNSITEENHKSKQQQIPSIENANTGFITPSENSFIETNTTKNDENNNTEQTSLKTQQLSPLIYNNNSIEPLQTASNELLERRGYIRYYNCDMKVPVAIETFGKGNIKLLDISRSGVGLAHNNNLHKGEIIPIRIKYKAIVIPAYIKVIASTNTRAGGTFVNLNKSRENKLLYLSIVLEADNNKLITRFR